MNGIFMGKIKWFSVQKGYGYIIGEKCGDVWFHNVDCPKDGSPPLRECEAVSFTVIKEAKGLRAKNIQRAFMPEGTEHEDEHNERG